MNVRAPAGLKTSGRALWKAVTSDFDLAEHERRLLVEACRCADQLDELAAISAAEGSMGPDGRVHPAVIEARQQRLTLARLVASLRVPDDGDVRPQRRGAARGFYGGMDGS
ncbi:hypothetical protein PSU4_17120 [Pseudonocardia sulfidoxydans NBRC 16205]|uniref:Uncharacterized protein n=2 Tax=Pseudonocardia sulfidoxydans TaxID=54011 RepID=A0A511DIC5_9PSEU|nr:terminase [Pseudonocardia sulfidoxydans]GEL22758.1 hypothetical protein PSU4_17120 [Pseudonocardia sulfidoxydans NBRC 16205]